MELRRIVKALTSSGHSAHGTALAAPASVGEIPRKEEVVVEADDVVGLEVLALASVRSGSSPASACVERGLLSPSWGASL